MSFQSQACFAKLTCSFRSRLQHRRHHGGGGGGGRQHHLVVLDRLVIVRRLHIIVVLLVVHLLAHGGGGGGNAAVVADIQDVGGVGGGDAFVRKDNLTLTNIVLAQGLIIGFVVRGHDLEDNLEEIRTNQTKKRKMEKPTESV